jgi:hypothetical protein
MKRGGDLYPHKPSPGHTLDEVLKSLRDLIRNDLPAGLVEAPSPAADDAPAPAESGIDAPPPPAPDPSSSELVSEVLAGLERELTELDDLDRSVAPPSEQESVPGMEIRADRPADTLDELAAAPPADDDGSFTEEDVRRAIEDQADDESAPAEMLEQDTAESPEDDFPDDDFPEHDVSADDFPEDNLPEDVIFEETETSVIAVDAEALADDEAMPMDILEPEAKAESIPVETPSTEAMDTPPAQPRMPAAEPPARLRDSLALIAPSREQADEEWSRHAVVAAPPMPATATPDETDAPIPESEAIPLLDDAIESTLPPDFAVRVRAIAIQSAARLEHEMRRAGRTPLATDLVPALARILEEALAQEFAQRQNDDFEGPEEGKDK